MKGQLSIEAVLVLAVFFLTLSVFLAAGVKEGKRALLFLEKTKARAKAEKCAFFVDSMAANPGLLPGLNEKCRGKGNSLVFYSDKNSEGFARTLARKIETVQRKTGFVLRVESEPHYG